MGNCLCWGSWPAPLPSARFPSSPIQGVSDLSHRRYPQHPVAGNHASYRHRSQGHAKLFAKETSTFLPFASLEKKPPLAARFALPLGVRAAGEVCHRRERDLQTNQRKGVTNRGIISEQGSGSSYLADKARHHFLPSSKSREAQSRSCKQPGGSAQALGERSCLQRCLETVPSLRIGQAL